MNSGVKAYLQDKGYTYNSTAQEYITVCKEWYQNKEITEFHKRKTINGSEYGLNRLNFAKRCCSDDANLCEVIEINAGGKSKDQQKFIEDIFAKNRFNSMYRKQLELMSALGTEACYIRLDNADYLDNDTIKGGTISLNYVNADGFIPLTVVNGEVIEAGFCGSGLDKGKKVTTLVIFMLSESSTSKQYIATTVVFNENDVKISEIELTLGDVKPFAVLHNADVNNLDNMVGYGLPKIWNAIPMLKILDLAFNILYGDLDKGQKIVLVNDLLCTEDKDGKPVLNAEQKKLFVLVGDKLPEENSLIHEYNPEIRIDAITKSFETALSLLSMMFGYGTKKYTFENGQIKTATEYAGEKQDSMQELNKQRQEAETYIADIVRAVLWFANAFQGTSYDIDAEILTDFDDSYVEDKTSKLDSMRADALSFAEIPFIKQQYLMEKYNLTEAEAKKYIEDGLAEEEPEEPQD